MSTLKKYTILPSSFSGGINNVVERTRDGTIQREMDQIKAEIARMAIAEKQPVYMLGLSDKSDPLDYAFTFTGVTLECSEAFIKKIIALDIVSSAKEITNPDYEADLERKQSLYTGLQMKKPSSGPRR